MKWIFFSNGGEEILDALVQKRRKILAHFANVLKSKDVVMTNDEKNYLKWQQYTPEVVQI